MKSPVDPHPHGHQTLTLKGIKADGTETVLKEWDGTENIVSHTRRSDRKYDIVFEVRNDCNATTLRNISDYSKYRIFLKYQAEEAVTRAFSTTPCSDETDCPTTDQGCSDYNERKFCYTEYTGGAIIYACNFTSPRGSTCNCEHDSQCPAGQLCDGSHCYWSPHVNPVVYEGIYLELNTPTEVLN